MEDYCVLMLFMSFQLISFCSLVSEVAYRVFRIRGCITITFVPGDHSRLSQQAALAVDFDRISPSFLLLFGFTSLWSRLILFFLRKFIFVTVAFYFLQIYGV